MEFNISGKEFGCGQVTVKVPSVEIYYRPDFSITSGRWIAKVDDQVYSNHKSFYVLVNELASDSVIPNKLRDKILGEFINGQS